MKLTDENLEQFNELVASTIEELVFMKHHVNDDDLEQGCDVMTQIGLNVDALLEILDESAPAVAAQKLGDDRCEKCNGAGVIVYAGGDRTLDCECRESPYEAVNNEGKATA